LTKHKIIINRDSIRLHLLTKKIRNNVSIPTTHLLLLRYHTHGFF
jgi:hypothetical protein